MPSSTPASDAVLSRALQLSDEGDHKAGIALLGEIIAKDPRAFRARLLRAKLLFRSGRHPEAVQEVRTAERYDPLQAEFRRIQQAVQARNLEAAREVAAAMLESEPGHPRAIFTLAHIAQTKADHEERVALLARGIETSPANIALRQMMVPALEDAGQIAEALDEARHIVEIEPSFQNIWGLTTILFRYGQNEEALVASKKAEKSAGSQQRMLAEISLVRGQILRILGRRNEAVDELRACLERNPVSGAAWWALADMKNYTFSDDDTERMAKLAEHPRVEPESRCMAAFALAKAREASDTENGSLALYHTANRLHPNKTFKPSNFLGAADRLIEAFTPEALETTALAEDQEEPRPIFIVGMPRSGSTLLEQILASHSQIEGTIESLVLPSVRQQAHRHCADALGGDYLDKVGMIDARTLTALGTRYLEESRLFHSGESPLFTDKLPYNFEHIGLITKILPRAIIIDARRNPLDCGLSIYKQYFAHGSVFSYDLRHIGAYYNGYLRIMDHWDRVLPGSVLRVQYEDMVRDTEAQIRRLLDHVGVPFEESCLRFHETQRAVRTASSEQVRQPISSKSIGTWKAFGAELEPLKQALGSATIDRFTPYLG